MPTAHQETFVKTAELTVVHFFMLLVCSFGLIFNCSLHFQSICFRCVALFITYCSYISTYLYCSCFIIYSSTMSKKIVWISTKKASLSQLEQMQRCMSCVGARYVYKSRTYTPFNSFQPCQARFFQRRYRLFWADN